MDKRIAGLLGAAAALTTMHAAQAAPAQPPQLAPAASYRDLLEPIPNALNVLKAEDDLIGASATEPDQMQEPEQLAQVFYHHHHHHHHHHHRFFRVIPPRVFRHHHHHHHHHHHRGFGVYIR